MASKTRLPPVGSSAWIQNEREQTGKLMDLEMEEFGFSVRNELEWLNEHLAEVFSKSNKTFADVFKTPGRLRGKTPRTARKRDGLQRAPLSDIFAPNGSVVLSTAPQKGSENQDKQTTWMQQYENAPSQRAPLTARTAPLQPADSGYHGLLNNSVDFDAQETEIISQESGYATQSTQPRSFIVAQSTLDERVASLPSVAAASTDEGPVSDESFVSANEGKSGEPKGLRRDTAQPDASATAECEKVEADAVGSIVNSSAPQQSDVAVAADTAHDLPAYSESTRSHSATSSPDRPLQRKSSFSFSSLPAREPLTAKRSVGARNSQMDARISATTKLHGESLDASQHGGEGGFERLEESRIQSKSSTQSLQERIKMLGKRSMPPCAVYPQLPGGETDPLSSQPPPVPPKSSPRPDSGVEDEDDDWIAPTKVANDHLRQRAETLKALEGSSEATKPSARPGMHEKSSSTTRIPSPTRPTVDSEEQSRPVSHPSFSQAVESTTPCGSPDTRRKQHEGPLSASKNRLWSALKSAKSIFASSASASAAAKLEAHSGSPSAHKSVSRPISNQDAAMTGVLNMPGAMYSTTQFQDSIDLKRPKSIQSLRSIISGSPSRPHTSGSETDKKKRKEFKELDEMETNLAKERGNERGMAGQRAWQQEEQAQDRVQQDQESLPSRTDWLVSITSEQNTTDGELHPSAQTKTEPPSGKLRAPGRILKPHREAVRMKPPPMNIRVVSQAAQRLQQPPQPFSRSIPEEIQTNKPVSGPSAHVANGSRTTLVQGNRASAAPQNAKVKALEAAARKKELEEKEKARKAEHKRALEAKRQAKLEEEKKVEEERKAEQKRALEAKKQARLEEDRKAEEQRRAAEARKAQEAKMAAQKERERLAAEHEAREEEKRRFEEAMRAEQQRKIAAERKAQDAHDLAAAIERERAQQTAHMQSRNDITGGTLRQLSVALAAEQSSAIPSRPPLPINPAKPAKRNLDEDDDPSSLKMTQSSAAPQRPVLMRGPPNYQQVDGKRRRTNDNEDEGGARSMHGPGVRGSAMAPPKRPSTMRKETLSKFPHGYAHAPPPAAHHSSSVFKATVTAQHQLQHAKPSGASHPSQFASGRIPFAENANPPHSSTNHHGGVQAGFGTEGTVRPGAYKTPARPVQAPKSAKSSPMYPNGENIALPEIATDSEDEDDEDDESGGFRAPSWAASPALRELLTQQQLVDPESVFGPIGELKMDEVFRNGKNQDRLKRLRERGSSAMWVQTGDAVTAEEKRKDMEMRERVVRDGGWRYAPGD